MNNNITTISHTTIITAEELTADILQHHIITTNIDQTNTFKVMPIMTPIEDIKKVIQKKPNSSIEVEVSGFSNQKRVFNQEGSIKLYNMMQIVEIIQQPPTIKIRNHRTGGFESLQVSQDVIQHLHDHNTYQDVIAPSIAERIKNLLGAPGNITILQHIIKNLKQLLQ